MLLEDLTQFKIQQVGNGWIDLICPWEMIEKFLDFCNIQGIKVKGFTWWCHVTDDHEPCGMGGPISQYFDGWFSEIQMDEPCTFETNEGYRVFLLDEWKNSAEYRECYWPAFWLE